MVSRSERDRAVKEENRGSLDGSRSDRGWFEGLNRSPRLLVVFA